MNLCALLEQQAIAQPTATAIIEGKSRKISFTTLVKRAAQGATFLTALGLQKGDAVLVFCPMSAELYIILGALWRLGLLALFIEPNATNTTLQLCCEHCQPQAIIAPSRAFLLLGRSPSLRKIPHRISIDCPLPTAKLWPMGRWLQPMETIAQCEPEHPALLTFTSGSTGAPKAAVRSHGLLQKQYQILAKYLDPQPQQINLTHLPIFALMNLAAGRTTLIPQGQVRQPVAIAPTPIINQILQHQPDSILASPAFLERLIDHCFRRQITLDTVQQIFSGGAPITPRLVWQLQHLAPTATIHVLYGSTEVEPISLLRNAQPAEIFAQGLCVGQPLPELQLRILPFTLPGDISDPDKFESLTLSCNQVGEIVVAGDHVLNSYLKNMGDRPHKIRVNNTLWHRTGDAGYLDDQQQLWLVGRCTECQTFALTQTKFLYPFILETTLQQHPKIKRAAVISHGQQGHLLIEQLPQTSPINPHEIYDLIQQDLEIHFIKKIPVDSRHNSKTLYHQLPKLIQGSFMNNSSRLSRQQD